MAGNDNDPLIKAGTAIYDRIRTSAKAARRDSGFAIRRFAIERFFVRLNQSPLAGGFALKGGMLMLLANKDMGRPTEDLDLTARDAFSIDLDEVRATFRSICSVEPSDACDGLTFVLDEKSCVLLRDEQVNPTVRLKIDVTLHTRYGDNPSRLKIDASFGDVITPAIRTTGLPETCRGFVPPVIPVYPWETVVAEKLHAIIKLGRATTRMRDFYDLVALARGMEFDVETLTQAVRATFERRNEISRHPNDRVDIVLAPVGLSDEFGLEKQSAWRSLMSQPGIQTPMPDFRAVLAEIRHFLEPVLESAAGQQEPDHSHWVPARGWVAAPGAGLAAA